MYTPSGWEVWRQGMSRVNLLAKLAEWLSSRCSKRFSLSKEAGGWLRKDIWHLLLVSTCIHPHVHTVPKTHVHTHPPHTQKRNYGKEKEMDILVLAQGL